MSHRTSGMRAALVPRRGERLLPAASGLLLVLSFPPFHLLVPPFVALVPFAIWLWKLPPDREGSRSALRGGGVLGVVYFGSLVYWILPALSGFTHLAVPAFLSMLGLLVLLAGLFGWTFHRMVHGLAVPIWLALPLSWTAVEWLQGNLGDLSFPWLGLGTSLTGFPALVGIAEVIGARGVTFWIALANGLLTVAILRRGEGRRWSRPALALALFVLLPMSWGVWRAKTIELRPAGVVALVQPNIPQHVKMDPEIVTDSTFRALETLMHNFASPVDLVAWPEVTLPEIVRDPETEAVRARVLALAVAAGSPILFGGYGRAGGEGGSDVMNSAFLMTPTGLDDFEYHKRRLVPVVERIPFMRPEWFGGDGYYGTLGRGGDRRLAQIEGSAHGVVAWGVLICFESIFAGASRDFRKAGADVLLNITNDAWFGGDSRARATTALWQHPAHMVMRAIENRVGVARAANTGISLFIDPVGRVYGATPVAEPAVVRDTVYTTDVVPLYTGFGDVLGSGAALAALLLLLGGAWRDRLATRGRGPPPG